MFQSNTTKNIMKSPSLSRFTKNLAPTSSIDRQNENLYVSSNLIRNSSSLFGKQSQVTAQPDKLPTIIDNTPSSSTHSRQNSRMKITSDIKHMTPANDIQSYVSANVNPRSDVFKPAMNGSYKPISNNIIHNNFPSSHQ